MKRYRFTSKQFGGHILFAYTDSGQCASVEFNTELNTEQIEYFARNFPMQHTGLEAIAGRTGKIELIEADLSFENFWNTYAVKINRKRAMPLWERLSRADRAACFAALPRYRYYCQTRGIARANPENYLRDRRWEDELNP